MSKKKFLITGLGSIGRRHLHNLELLGETDISLFRSHKGTIEDENLRNYPEFSDLGEALASKPDAVIISNPTSLHMNIATPAAEAGCALLIEKPIANNLDELTSFEKVFDRENPLVLTGYQFRFNPGLIKIKELLQKKHLGKPLSFQCKWGEYLPGWHPWEDYRKSFAAKKALGGGVVLTLSHPLDYLLWFFGNVKELFAFTGNSSDLEIDCEDTANVVLNFQSGVTGTLHLDYYCQPKQHELNIICSNGTIFWDYETSQVETRNASGEETVFTAPVDYERNKMYQAEMQHFIDCMNGTAKPVCTYEDGKRALALAIGILQSGKYNQRVIFNGTK